VRAVAGRKQKESRSKAKKYLLPVLLSGALLFAFYAAATLAAGSTYFWTAVVSDSMSHAGNPSWRVYFENVSVRREALRNSSAPIEEKTRTYDTSKFPIQDGFSRGDLLIVKHVSASEISVGDVIIVSRRFNRIPMVHRVLAIWEDEGEIRIVTKGDHNTITISSDLDIHPSEVIGKVVFVVPKLGWLSILIRGE
jgi:hypothetical protein